MLHRELKSLPRFSISKDVYKLILKNVYQVQKLNFYFFINQDSGRSTPVSTPDHIRELSPVEEGDRSGTGETPPQTASIMTPLPATTPLSSGGARPKNPLTQSLSPNFKQRSSSRSQVYILVLLLLDRWIITNFFLGAEEFFNIRLIFSDSR